MLLGLGIAAVFAGASLFIGVAIGPSWPIEARLFRSLGVGLVVWVTAGYALMQTISGWVAPEEWDPDEPAHARALYDGYWRPATPAQRYGHPILSIVFVAAGALVVSLLQA